MSDRKNKRPMDYAVKDATKDLTITIDADDIKGAKRRKENSCAVAYALCRLAVFNEARVYRNITYARKLDGTWVRFRTPDDLYIELMVFDRGGRMQTGEYILKAPKGSQRLGQHPKPTGKRLTTGKVPRTPHIIENARAVAPKGHGALKALFE